jgi:uncharacterized membrane protein
MRYRIFLLVFITFLFLLASPMNPVGAQTAVVRAVLFYSDTCPHCHEVMEVHLPPLAQKYGQQLDIVGIDVNHEVGYEMYQAMLVKFNVPDERVGVPTLVVGSEVLVGSVEIPERLPGIIEQGLASGGIDWPDIPGLKAVLEAQTGPSTERVSTAPQVETPAPTENSPVFVQRFMMDPLANTIAVVVLIGMIGSVMAVGYHFLRGSDSRLFHWPGASILILAILGMGVAFYLSYVEITKTEAICGPVGNCNSVQESPYAYLFGVIPVGALGMAGYAAIVASWLFSQYGPKSWSKFFKLAIWVFAWFGILFSIYLTFLEPFVIGATCAWCITSAIIMTLIFWAATGPAIDSLKIQDELDEDQVEEDEVYRSSPEMQ